MTKRMLIAWLSSVALAAGAGCATAAEKEAPAAKPRQLSLENRPWKGDFDQMLERRMIRVLAPYSRTLFYIDKGRERGVAAEVARDSVQSHSVFMR